MTPRKPFLEAADRFAVGHCETREHAKPERRRVPALSELPEINEATIRIQLPGYEPVTLRVKESELAKDVAERVVRSLRTLRRKK